MPDLLLRIQRLFDRRGVRLALLLALASGVGWVSWKQWGEEARSFAFEIKGQLGLELVEGHKAIIEEAAAESQVDPFLIAAIMYQESRGRGGQTSYAGAHGLMQLVPSAAEDAAKRLGLPKPTVDQLLRDDRLNVRLGSAHLAWLLQHRGEWNLEAVLVSYNAGRTKLFRWIDRHGGYENWRTHEHELHEAGEKTTGTLEYAAGTIGLIERFRERGVITEVAGVGAVQ